MVETLFSWLNRFRKLLFRFEKKARNYFGLLHFAGGIMVMIRVLAVHAHSSLSLS
ncbi:hypothetical protein GE073_18825 [Paenibacillus sp. B01]|nr:hypothetical protein GE073_18825 [Paenibacillus sp. B01]